MANQGQGSFQPNIPEQTDFNYLAFSRGIDVPRGFGKSAMSELFSGVAQLFDMGINAADTLFQSAIRDEATREVDRVRAEFGVDAVADTQAPVGVGPTPDGLRRAYREIEGLTAAVQAGRLKESHYWGRLDSVARQLRHKYPGYREQIDQVISNLTGANPANAVRRALFNEAEEAARLANTEAQQFLTKEHQAAKDGLLGGDYWVLKEQGKITTLEDLTRYVAPRAYAKAMVTAHKTNLEVAAAENRMNKENRNTSYAQSLHHLFSTTLSPLLTKDYPKLLADIENYARNLEQGNIPSPQDRNILVGQLQELEVSMRTAIENHRLSKGNDGSEPSWAELFAADTDYANIEEQFMRRFSVLKDALEKGDVALLKASAAFLEAGKTAEGIRLFSEYPKLRTIDAVRSMVGDAVMGHIYMKQSGLFNALQDIQFQGEVFENILEARPLKQSIRNAKTSGNADAKFTKELLRTNIGILLNPNTPDHVFSNVVEAMYGKNNIGFHNEVYFEERFIDPATNFETIVHSQHQLFELMTSEQIAQKIKRVADEKGDQRLWENYKDWTKHTGSVLAKRDIDDWRALVSNPTFQRGFLDIWFDPETKRFETFEKPQAEFDRNLAFIEANARQTMANQARQLTRRLNASFGPILKVHEIEGADPFDVIARILAAQGIELAPARPSFPQRRPTTPPPRQQEDETTAFETTVIPEAPELSELGVP